MSTHFLQAGCPADLAEDIQRLAHQIHLYSGTVHVEGVDHGFSVGKADVMYGWDAMKVAAAQKESGSSFSSLESMTATGPYFAHDGLHVSQT